MGLQGCREASSPAQPSPGSAEGSFPSALALSCRGQLGLQPPDLLHSHFNIHSMLAISKHNIADNVLQLSLQRTFCHFNLFPQLPQERGLGLSPAQLSLHFQEQSMMSNLRPAAPAQGTTSSALPTSTSAATQDLLEAGQEMNKPTHSSDRYFDHRRLLHEECTGSPCLRSRMMGLVWGMQEKKVWPVSSLRREQTADRWGTQSWVLM